MNVGDKINGYEIVEIFKKQYSYFDHKYQKQRQSKHTMAIVRCLRCGDEKSMQLTSVTRQGCKQGVCHPNFVDISGTVFGDLTVVEPVMTKNKNRRLRWMCLCSCGAEVLVPLSQLRNGQKACKSCTGTRVQTLPNDCAKWNRVARQYRQGARSRKLSFQLTKSQIKTLCLGKCHYCWSSPMEDALGLERNGIDRVDNVEGYTISNTVTCCQMCNRMKLNFTTDNFFHHVARIYNHQKRSKC